MKKVKFVGKYWDVPEWAKYLTQDLTNGAVIAWEKAPEFGNAFWSSSAKDWLDPGQSRCLGHVQVLAPVMKIGGIPK